MYHLDYVSSLREIYTDFTKRATIQHRVHQEMLDDKTIESLWIPMSFSEAQKKADEYRERYGVEFLICETI